MPNHNLLVVVFALNKSAENYHQMPQFLGMDHSTIWYRKEHIKVSKWTTAVTVHNHGNFLYLAVIILKILDKSMEKIQYMTH